MASNIVNVLIAFVFLAVVGVAIAITYGVTGLIQNSLNGTLTIPASIQSGLDTSASMAGTGLTVAAAVLIIMIIMGLVYIFARSGRE